MLIENSKVFHELTRVYSEPCVFFFWMVGYSISKWRVTLDLLRYPVKKQSANHVAAIIPPARPSKRPFLDTIYYLNDFTMLLKLFCQCLQTSILSARASAEKRLVVMFFYMPKQQAPQNKPSLIKNFNPPMTFRRYTCTHCLY